LDFPSRCGGIDRVPNWVRLSSDRLVGRDEELVGAVKAIHRVAEGRPGVMIVSGPAGIGKSRFVSALAEQLRSEGMRAMVGACLDLGAGAPPYSSLIKAFRSVDPPAVQLLDALTGAVRMRRSRLFELLRSTTVGLAKRRPTVLVIEDVHWSDRITRDVLLYLVAMAREGRWALIVTFRDESEVDGAWTAAFEFGLTNRELEVLPLLVAGRTNAEIADVLVISPRTVGIHVSRILTKLGASRRTEAAEIARRRGLVDD
jgi:DNA-binding CsgD family transcriptional regulator